MLQAIHEKLSYIVELTFSYFKGNVYSGDWIVPFLDSKLGLDISWGCTKRALDGRCADPWASVKTRLRFPPPSILGIAEKHLLKLFGLTLAEMEHVPQLKRKYTFLDSSLVAFNYWCVKARKRIDACGTDRHDKIPCIKMALDYYE